MQTQTLDRPHIRLVAMGTRGDVQPYIALALGLQQAGHDVVVGTTADFREFVEGYGLRCITTKSDMQAVAKQGARGRVTVNGRQYRNAKMAFFGMLLDATLELSEGADVLVYSSALTLTAPHVADKLGIPAFPALLQPYMTPTADFPAVGMPGLPLGGWYNRLTYSMFERFVWLFLKGPINQWRRDVLDMPAYAESGPFASLRSDLPTLYGFSPSVLSKPEEWEPTIHVTGYWFLPTQESWQPSPELSDFLAAGPPPVYIGFGSMASRNPEETTQLVLRAVREAGVRAILATGWEGLAVSAKDDEVIVLESAPHDWLFPRMAAVVHHGGAGTTGASLRAGVPTIVVPFKGDQPFWGRRVAELGVGPNPIPRKQLTPAKLASRIRQAVTDTAMQTRASALGEQIRAEDGVGNAVRVIENILHSMAR